MKSFILFIVMACGLALVLAFGASNDELVTLNYLIAQNSIKLSYLLFGAFITGVVFTAAIMSLLILKLKMSLHRAKGKAQRQTNEIDKLRAISVKE